MPTLMKIIGLLAVLGVHWSTISPAGVCAHNAPESEPDDAWSPDPTREDRLRISQQLQEDQDQDDEDELGDEDYEVGPRGSLFDASAKRYAKIVQKVNFVVIHKRDKTGYVPRSQLTAQIAQLNRAFSGAEARSTGYGKATDAGISFTLANVKYVEHDEHFQLCALYNYQPVIKKAHAMNPKIYLNIYICNVGANLGLAWLPYQAYKPPGNAPRAVPKEDNTILGCMVHHQLVAGNNYQGGVYKQGDICTHEVGHHYGLAHPYEDGCLGFLDSDMVADTPRGMINQVGWCKNIKKKDTCPGGGADDISNYMYATDDVCRNHFTPGQVARMRSIIAKYKPSLARGGLLAEEEAAPPTRNCTWTLPNGNECALPFTMGGKIYEDPQTIEALEPYGVAKRAREMNGTTRWCPKVTAYSVATRSLRNQWGLATCVESSYQSSEA